MKSHLPLDRKKGALNKTKEFILWSYVFYYVYIVLSSVYFTFPLTLCTSCFHSPLFSLHLSPPFLLQPNSISQTLSHSHSLKHTHTQAHSLSISLTLSHSLSLSLSPAKQHKADSLLSSIRPWAGQAGVTNIDTYG